MIFAIFPAFATQVNDEDHRHYRNIVNPLQGVLSDPSNETEPDVEFVDFHNGTRQIIIDYKNGTWDYITETFIRKTAKLQICEDQANRSLSTTLPTSLEEATDYNNITQTVMTEQEVLLGFTWDLIYSRFKPFNVLIGYIIMGIDIDIQFGLRLPVNVTLEYPEQMTIGENYTLYATLVPIDKPNYDEFVLLFNASVWAEAHISVWPILDIQFPRTEILGEHIDGSKSFTTPLGSEVEPIFSDLLNINLFDLMELLFPELGPAIDVVSILFVPYITFEPAFGSEKITAKATAHGDSLVVKGNNLMWSTPGQRVNFTVHADEYDSSTNHTKISLSDFRYYFTNFVLNVELLFDLNGLLNGWPLYWADPEFFLGALDLSNLTEGLYLGGHSGTPGKIDISIYVERVVPPPEVIEPRDVGILWATVYPKVLYIGQVLNTTVTVRNLGNVTEDTNVTVHLDTMLIGTYTITDLEPKQETTLIFLFNTSELLPSTYNITTEVSEVPYETDTTDNFFTVGTIEVRVPEYILTIRSVPSGVTFTVDGESQTTPWSKIYHEETSVTLEMPETYNEYVWSHWFEDGDPNRTKTITLPGTTWTGVFIQPHGPEAEFTAIPDTASTGESIKFDASASLPGFNGTQTMLITEYRWDFGDGNEVTTSTLIVYHSFSSSGIYYVTLTVYASGATPETDSTTHKVTVITTPVGGYSIPIKTYTTEKPLTPYLALIAILATVFTMIKRKKNTRTKRH